MKIIGSKIIELKVINGAKHGFYNLVYEKQVIDLILEWFNKCLCRSIKLFRFLKLLITLNMLC